MGDIVITVEMRLRVILAHHRVFAVSLYPAIHIVIALLVIVFAIITLLCHRTIDSNLNSAMVNYMALSGFHRYIGL